MPSTPVAADSWESRVDRRGSFISAMPAKGATAEVTAAAPANDSSGCPDARVGSSQVNQNAPWRSCPERFGLVRVRSVPFVGLEALLGLPRFPLRGSPSSFRSLALYRRHVVA
jgi:hypothetical protein